MNTDAHAKAAAGSDDGPTSVVMHDPAPLLQRIAELEKINAAQALELEILRHKRTFLLFSKLPIELRTTIWEFAFRTPQTYALEYGVPLKSPVNAIMQACHESQTVGKRLHLDGYTHKAQPIQYMNIDLDTFWLKGVDSAIESYDARFICGCCQLPVLRDESLNMRCKKGVRLNRLAIHDSQWVDPWETPNMPFVPYQEASALIVRMVQPREVLIIVGDTPRSSVKCFKYDAPQQHPRDLMPKLYHKSQDSNIWGPLYGRLNVDFDWEALCKWRTDKIRKLRENQMEYIKNCKTGSCPVPTELYTILIASIVLEGKTMRQVLKDKGFSGYKAYSLWEPPVVRHVQMCGIAQE